MEKSNVEKLKEALVYAPVGAFGFVKDNAPTFFSMFVSRGRRDVTKTTMQAEEKLSSTKNHGQIVAMGTPIAKDKAENLATEAKNKGEEITDVALGLATSAFSFANSTIRGLIDTVTEKTEAESTEDKRPEAETAQSDTNEESGGEVATPPADATEPTMTPENVAYSYSEDGFIAEPVNPNVKLPTDIKSIYERLSAPEIIDRLDEYSTHQLSDIRSFESGFRNRQTIIHAINYRLEDY